MVNSDIGLSDRAQLSLAEREQERQPIALQRKRLWHSIYFQVLLAIAVGIGLGWADPYIGTQMKVFGDLFIRCVRMLLVPIVFATITVGIARMVDLKQLGRVGLRTVIYFEVASTLALAIGLIVGNVFKPGDGINADLSHADMSSIAKFTKPHASMTDSILHVVPDSIVQSFANGDILPVLLFSVLFGVGLSIKREATQGAIDTLDSFLHGLFAVMEMVMRLAPLGAFGAMAFTVGKYGLGSLLYLAKLVICVYGSSALFVFVVLGTIARLAGFRIVPFLKFIRTEIAIVLGTCSSESVLPQLMQKLERAGCSKPIVGLVMPTGITFNPDGSSIYLSLATLFIAQATNTPMSITQQLALLAVLLLTSKGSAGVAGAGFIALAATLSTVDSLPVAGLTLLLGVDRFMNEARAITNTIGNAVATVVIAKWEGVLDQEMFESAIHDEKLISDIV